MGHASGTAGTAVASAAPPLTVVVVTRNERRDLPDCLDALLRDEDPSLAVVVVDAASEDGTQEIARAYAARDVRVRPVLRTERLPVGEARDVGVAAAGPGRAVAFVSADTVPAPTWAHAARDALRRADVAYGPQEHAPPRHGLVSTVRGLRYHHFERGSLAPEAYASHANAALSPRALEGWRFAGGEARSALDDVLFAHGARARGLRVTFEPAMLVRHKDAATFRSEWRKVRREGRGWGSLRRELGPRRDVLLWGAATGAATGAAVLLSVPAAFLLPAAMLYGPALRRVTRGALRRYGPARVGAAVAVSPLFDLAFLASYLEGRVNPR